MQKTISVPCFPFLALLAFLAGGPALAQPPAVPDRPVLYRMQMIQAAPGRLPELIDAVKQRVAIAAQGGDETPVIFRHQQGDHWDLGVLWPMGDWTSYYDPARVARREAAAKAAGGPSIEALERRLDPLVSWHEDLFMRGPAVADLRAHVKDAGLLHYEMMQTLPGTRDALIVERHMENAYNRERGRGVTLVFTREAGSDWDVVTLGVYRNWTQYAESDRIPPEVSDAAARKAGFESAASVGVFMRTLISTHRDSLGSHIRN